MSLALAAICTVAFYQGVVHRDCWRGFVYQAVTLIALAGAVTWAG